MRIPRIYTSEPLAVGAAIRLGAQSSRHLISVLRLKPGAELILFNGTGGEYRSQLLEHDEQPLVTTGKVSRFSQSKAKSSKPEKSAAICVNEFIDVNRESPLFIELGIGISRGERMDWVIQKSTELGVQKITPLFTERTEVKLKGERQQKKCVHWRQVAISACEQSGRTRLPEIVEPIALADWVPTLSPRFVLDPCASMGLQNYKNESLSDGSAAIDRPTQVALLVGPEGGLSEAEVLHSINVGFIGISLGQRILRTETAPLVAITQCQTLWGDLSVC